MEENVSQEILLQVSIIANQVNNMQGQMNNFQEQMDNMQNQMKEMDAKFSSSIADLAINQLKIKEEITSVRSELKEEIASVRTELKEEITSVQTKFDNDIKEIQKQLNNISDDVKFSKHVSLTILEYLEREEKENDAMRIKVSDHEKRIVLLENNNKRIIPML